MVYIIFLLVLISFIFFEIGRRKKGVDIFFAPLQGCMLGAIYNIDEFENGHEHYMQVAFLFFTFNIIYFIDA